MTLIALSYLQQGTRLPMLNQVRGGDTRLGKGHIKVDELIYARNILIVESKANSMIIGAKERRTTKDSTLGRIPTITQG